MNVLAASAPETIGLFIAVFMVVGWLLYVVVNWRQRDESTRPGAEIELAPNRRPGNDDDTLEGPRLERVLGWALILLIIVSIGPLVYWLNEPSRQAGAVKAFDDQAVARGEELFQPSAAGGFGCADCHGSVGQGGSTEFSITDYLGRSRQVVWQAPALDTAALKFSDEELRTILVYGRPNTPMPAWGTEGGGPMNEQMITDLVAYMKSLTISREEARERAAEEATALAAQLGVPEGEAQTSGAVLFAAHCARCHTKGWTYGEPALMGGGAFGPNLTNGVTVRQFPDVEDMVEFVALGSEYGTPYGVRGVGGDEGGGMPGFGEILTPEQIRAVVDYVRSL